MWRLYCKDDGVPGQGVALESNLAMVETSVGAHDLFVSPVSYRYYHEGPAFYDELDAFMHKRMGFAHENEVRLLKYDEAQYLRLDEAATAAAVVEDLPVHIFLAWPAREAIESIVVSPYASRAYEKGVREQVASIATSLSARVTLSVLSEGRYESQF